MSIIVNVDNFARAETDRMFAGLPARRRRREAAGTTTGAGTGRPADGHPA